MKKLILFMLFVFSLILPAAAQEVPNKDSGLAKWQEPLDRMVPYQPEALQVLFQALDSRAYVDPDTGYLTINDVDPSTPDLPHLKILENPTSINSEVSCRTLDMALMAVRQLGANMPSTGVASEAHGRIEFIHCYVFSWWVPEPAEGWFTIAANPSGYQITKAVNRTLRYEDLATLWLQVRNFHEGVAEPHVVLSAEETQVVLTDLPVVVRDGFMIWRLSRVGRQIFVEPLTDIYASEYRIYPQVELGADHDQPFFRWRWDTATNSLYLTSSAR